MIVVLVFVLLGYFCGAVISLSSDETYGIIRIAREYKRGGENNPPDLEKASQLYKKIVDEGTGPSYVDALFELASIGTQQPSESFALLSKASELGHAMAQHQLSAALYTGVGVGGLVPRDPGRSLLLEQFSALSGTPEAHLGMGYRYLMGEGVPKSCENAIPYLEFAANEAAWQMEERGHSIYFERSYLSRGVEAAVAAGSSVGRGEINNDMINYYEHLAEENDENAVQSLVHIYSQGSKEVPVDIHKVMKYLLVAATDFKSSVAAGQLGYMMATSLDRKSPFVDKGIGSVFSDANKVEELLQYSYENQDSWGILGMGYCHYKGGCGDIERNFTRALESFQRVHGKHPEAAFYIGELLMGMGGLYELEEVEAEGVAAEGGPDATNRPALAEIQVDVASAFQFYTSASARGHLLSTHRLGQIHLWGGAVIEDRADYASVASDREKGIKSSYAQRRGNRRGRGGASIARSCESAAVAFKSVAERGDWSQQLNVAHSLYNAGDRCGALRLFSQLATMGYETAQANAAFILSQQKLPCQTWITSEQVDILVAESRRLSSHFKNVESLAIPGAEQWEASRNYSEFSQPLMLDSDHVKEERNGKLFDSVGENDGEESTGRTYTTSDLLQARALSLYRQSAILGNADSFRKMGDLHYYGKGGLNQDKHEASLLYQLAADYGLTHAMFNLGVMHEMGDGVEQDFHLAKRYYDQTAEYDPSARIPSLVAVYFLRAHKEFQQYMGREFADRVGMAVVHFLSPLLRISDWRESLLSTLFPETSGSQVSSANVDFDSERVKKGELSSYSFLIWKCWDKFNTVWDVAVSTLHGIAEYMLRFTNRFSKSPQQAVSSLLIKIKKFFSNLFFVEGDDNGLDNLRSDSNMAREFSPSETSTTPQPPKSSGYLNLDADAAADLELILLLTLMVMFLVLIDYRRQRMRARRRRERERRRREWEHIIVPDIRACVQKAEAKNGVE